MSVKMCHSYMSGADKVHHGGTVINGSRRHLGRLFQAAHPRDAVLEVPVVAQDHDDPDAVASGLRQNEIDAPEHRFIEHPCAAAT